MENQAMNNTVAGSKISEMPHQQNLTGNEMVPFAMDGANGRFNLKQLFDRINDAVSGLASSAEVEWQRALLTEVDGRLDRITGTNANEIIDTLTEVQNFLEGITDKEKLTGLLTELRTAIQGNTEKIEGLEVKEGQFGIAGRYIHPSLGTLNTDSKTYNITDFIPINKQYDIVVNAQVSQNASAIALYNARREFLGGCGSGDGRDFIGGVVIDGSTFTLPHDKIPANAVYFRSSAYMESTTVPNPSWQNGPTREAREGAVADVVAEAKKLRFIDQWNSACGKYGKYNAKTGFFELNGLTDITYEQAIPILLYSGFVFSSIDMCIGGALCKVARTNIRPQTYQLYYRNLRFSHFGWGGSSLEVLAFEPAEYSNTFNFYIQDANFALQSCPNCHTILGTIDISRLENEQRFFTDSKHKMKEFRFKGLKKSIIFSSAAHISLESFQFLISNATNTDTITITVHPDVYAKLTDTANAEWNAVLTDGANRKISFATV